MNELELIKTMQHHGFNIGIYWNGFNRDYQASIEDTDGRLLLEVFADTAEAVEEKALDNTARLVL